MRKKRLTLRSQIGIQAIFAVLGLFVMLPIWATGVVAFDGALKGRVPIHFRLWPEQPSLETFQEVLVRPAQTLTFWGLFKNSMIVSGGSALVALAFGLSCAYAFARFRFPGRQPGLFGLLLGTLLPPVAIMTPLYLMLTLIGIRTTLLGLMVAYTSFAMPFCVWNMRAAFQGVPVDLEEAAMLDGAGRWLTFWRVTLPLALPSIAVATLIAFLMSYTEFAIGWLFVERSETVTLAMAVSNLGGAVAKASALGLVMSVPVIVVFVILRRTLMQGALLGTIHEED